MIVLTSGLLAAPSSQAGTPNLAGRDLELAFTTADPVGTTLAAGTTFTNTGTATELTATAVYANSGVFKVGQGFGGGNTAIAAPAHIAAPADTPKSAIVRIVNTTATDRLDPGTSDFSFGADFLLNTASSTADSKDNGDNLIQRGLSGSATQYKIQIDAGKPSCVLRQGATTIITKTSQAISRNVWYRVACQRTTSAGTTTVTLTVTQLSNGAVVPATPGTGPAIDLSIATAVPLSVGGKLSDAGAVILSATDQFNGRIDNAFLDLP